MTKKEQHIKNVFDGLIYLFETKEIAKHMIGNKDFLLEELKSNVGYFDSLKELYMESWENVTGTDSEYWSPSEWNEFYFWAIEQ